MEVMGLDLEPGGHRDPSVASPEYFGDVCKYQRMFPQDKCSWP